MALKQCTKAIKNRLKVEETYEDIDGEYNVIRILLIIKSIAYSYKSKSYPVLAIHMSLRKFYSSYQSILALCDKYFKTMTNLRDIISPCVWIIENHTFLVDKFMKAAEPADPDNPTENETAASNTATEEAYVSTAFISGLNKARYWVLLNKLHNTLRMVRD